MKKLSDLKKIIDTLVETYPDMELDVVYRYISDSERIANLEGVIQELMEFVEKYSDVVDGDDGQPEPNHAMSLVTMAQDVLERKHD
jgi:C4-type Zn-finger protein